MASSKLNKWMSKMQELEGAVTLRRDVHKTVLRSSSPSTNFIFGGGYGLPRGFSMVLYGKPGSGKSMLTNDIIGQMHRDYPEAVAVKFNTELREEAQLSPASAKVWGIDLDRYLPYNVNAPELIFNRIQNEVGAMAEEVDVGLIIIDSINLIQGRRAAKQMDVNVQNIGDLAATLKDGLRLVLPVQRKNNISVILCSHVTAEMDPGEQMRGNTVKMSAGNGTQHYAEYFVMTQKIESKAGRLDLLENELKDETNKDLMGHSENTGHKVRVVMKKSSFGAAGRAGEFTLDYKRGIINQHEELFLLGKNRGIIENSGPSYTFDGTKWVGKAGILEAIKTNVGLQTKLWDAIVKSDNGEGVPENVEAE